jgi:putative DNA methylase
MTHHLQGGVPNHGFTHWWTMFNPRQLLVHTQLLKAIVSVGSYDWQVREFVLGAFQQYLRNQSLFTLWNVQGDKLEPHFANNNFHPKSTVVENCVFASLGRGNWASCVRGHR